MKLLVEIPDEDKRALVRAAIIYGFLREEPRKSWTEREYKEAIRFALTAWAKETANDHRRIAG